MTGVLSKTKRIKMLWKLISNPTRTDWHPIDVFFVGNQIKRNYYVNSTNRINNLFINDEVYGVSQGRYNNNLKQIKRIKEEFLKINDGLIEFIFDQ